MVYKSLIIFFVFYLHTRTIQGQVVSFNITSIKKEDLLFKLEMRITNDSDNKIRLKNFRRKLGFNSIAYLIKSDSFPERLNESFLGVLMIRRNINDTITINYPVPNKFPHPPKFFNFFNRIWRNLKEGVNSLFVNNILIIPSNSEKKVDILVDTRYFELSDAHDYNLKIIYWKHEENVIIESNEFLIN